MKQKIALRAQANCSTLMTVCLGGEMIFPTLTAIYLSYASGIVIGAVWIVINVSWWRVMIRPVARNVEAMFIAGGALVNSFWLWLTLLVLESPRGLDEILRNISDPVRLESSGLAAGMIFLLLLIWRSLTVLIRAWLVTTPRSATGLRTTPAPHHKVDQL